MLASASLFHEQQLRLLHIYKKSFQTSDMYASPCRVDTCPRDNAQMSMKARGAGVAIWRFVRFAYLYTRKQWGLVDINMS